jgi:PAS domain S-box-containing protein
MEHLLSRDAQARGGEPDSVQSIEELGDGRLAQLVRELADAVVIADPDGVIVFWNEAATKLFGWSAQDARGRSLDLIIPERLRARHWVGYRRVMETGHTDYGSRLLEVPAVHQDGRTISVAFTVTLLVRAGERPGWIAAVLRDDTAGWHERRRTRERLSELEAVALRAEQTASGTPTSEHRD